MKKTIISEKWELIPLEQRKLVRSFMYGVLALVSLFIADYLTQFGLPKELEILAPFVPVMVNFLNKWARTNQY